MSAAQLPETTGACYSQKALDAGQGSSAGGGLRYMTPVLVEYTLMQRKMSVWGVRHLFSLNFIYPFKGIPWGRWGLKEKSMCPCHSTLTAWTGAFPREIEQKAVEEEEASPVTPSVIAEEGHRGGTMPGRFPQIPKDSQEAGIIIRRHSPLIEMSPCPPAPL